MVSFRQQQLTWPSLVFLLLLVEGGAKVAEAVHQVEGESIAVPTTLQDSCDGPHCYSAETSDSTSLLQVKSKSTLRSLATSSLNVKEDGADGLSKKEEAKEKT